ncbi:Uncharacterized mitochondrial protein AtMg01250, partial [Linum perenne]
MKRRPNVKVGDLALKIDISKAYDRVKWSYLESVLKKLGFHTGWVKLMMNWVKPVEYAVNINGSLMDKFKPSRGLRQGCPLSPFLFILCAEGLLALVRREIGRGSLRGIMICRGAPC